MARYGAARRLHGSCRSDHAATPATYPDKSIAIRNLARNAKAPAETSTLCLGGCPKGRL